MPDNLEEIRLRTVADWRHCLGLIEELAKKSGGPFVNGKQVGVIVQ